MRRIHRWPVLLVAALLLWICGTAVAADMNPDLATVRRLLGQSDATIDLAQAKVTIDRLIAPDTDTVATLRQIDALAAAIRRRIPPRLRVKPSSKSSSRLFPSRGRGTTTDRSPMILPTRLVQKSRTSFSRRTSPHAKGTAFRCRFSL